MSFSDNEFIAILEAAADFADYRSGQYFIRQESRPASGGSALRLRDPSKLPPWAIDLRRMFGALAEFDFNSNRGSPLARLCEAGARFGLQELDSTLGSEFPVLVSTKAKRCLKRDLERILQGATRPCLELERKSYNLALVAMGFEKTGTDGRPWDVKFVGKKPSERLFAIFGRFPVLPRLWLQLISQWCDKVAELLTRLVADRTALSGAFLGGQPAGPIVEMRCGLSDPHKNGRTVMLLQFASGSVIYKPRPGDGEWEWNSLLEWMNAHSFRPRLRPGRVLRRKGYCWMEWIEVAPCKNAAAARRFYERLGGMIAAACLLKAVDCHRDNLISAGEDPVLVDAETLWHVSPGNKAQTPLDFLYRTGFFQNANSRSLQSRSSALGPGTAGRHVPRLAGRPLKPRHYRFEIARGFARAWRCILGDRSAQEMFARKLRRIRATDRRWIYRATEAYAAIRDASIQPQALRSGRERERLLRRRCTSETVGPTVVDAEVRALMQLDIPYFVVRSKQRLPSGGCSVLPELIQALHAALPDPR